LHQRKERKKKLERNFFGKTEGAEAKKKMISSQVKKWHWTWKNSFCIHGVHASLNGDSDLTT
jgi:hypothetical protein